MCLAASLLVVTVKTETASVVVRWKPASQLPEKSAASPGAETRSSFSRSLVKKVALDNVATIS